MPGSHSTYAPSAAHRWVRCPGSIALTAGADDGGSIHAAEGTAAHELAERSLRSGREPAEFKGEIIEADGYQFEVDASMIEHVTSYTTAVLARPGELFIEQRLDLSNVLKEPDQGGTGDAVIIEDGMLEVHDLKYGRKGTVYAEGNEQLMLYAAGAADMYDLLGPFHTYRLFIHQPRQGRIDSAEITAAELDDFIGTARAAVIVSKLAEPELVPGEKQCRWCPAKVSCPALAAHIADTVFEDVSRGTVQEPPAEPLDLAVARGRVDLIQSWCKAVCAETEARLTAGLPVPGYKLIRGRRGARQWADPDEAEKRLKKARVKVDTMYRRTLISPTQAEQALTPARFKNIQDLIEQPDGKLQVAPESDPRPAVDQTAMFEDHSGESLI